MKKKIATVISVVVVTRRSLHMVSEPVRPVAWGSLRLSWTWLDLIILLVIVLIVCVQVIMVRGRHGGRRRGARGGGMTPPVASLSWTWSLKTCHGNCSRNGSERGTFRRNSLSVSSMSSMHYDREVVRCPSMRPILWNYFGMLCTLTLKNLRSTGSCSALMETYVQRLGFWCLKPCMMSSRRPS